MKLIIDTDVGIDDAVALLLALACPHVQIQAITAVGGNVPLSQVVHNIGAVLDVANAPIIPIYRGCAGALLPHKPLHAVEIHGEDGLGGAALPETNRSVEAEHAGLALIRLVRENPKQLTLLTLGPLTNVALAVRLAPDFLKNLKKFVVMGGNVDGRGNTTAAAEFNFMADPAAAAIVFNECSQNQITMDLISWEATLDHGIPVKIWDTMIDGDSSVVRFMQKITEHLKRVFPIPVVLWPDPLAAAVAIMPDIIEKKEERFISVETGDNLAQGQTIVDYRFNGVTRPNAHIIREVNLQKFQHLLQMAMQL